MTHAIDSVAPEPVAHHVAVGVNEQHAEGGSSDGVDRAGLRDAQVLEQHEARHAHCQSEHSIAVAHEPIGEAISVVSMVDIERDDHAANGKRHRQGRQPAPRSRAVRAPDVLGVEAEVAGDEVERGKPRHVVHADVALRHVCHDGIGEQEKPDERQVLEARHILHCDIEERNSEPEEQEARGKPIGHALHGQQVEPPPLQARALIATGEEHAIYHEVVEHYLQHELQEFSQRDLRLAHEVTRYHHEAVDARLAPHAKEPEEHRPRTPVVRFQRTVPHES